MSKTPVNIFFKWEKKVGLQKGYLANAWRMWGLFRLKHTYSYMNVRHLHVKKMHVLGASQSTKMWFCVLFAV